MKRYLLLSTLFVFLLTGCGLSVGINGATKKMNKKIKKVDIGMTLSEFQRAVPKARRVYSDVSGNKYKKIDGRVVYRLIVNYSYVGTDGNRWQLIRDFGFIDNYLEEIGGNIQKRIR